MRKARCYVAWMLVGLASCGAACGSDDDGGEPTPSIGTCDFKAQEYRCREMHDASAIDMQNQEEGCGDYGGVWSNDPCPTEDLVGCCDYTFGNEFRDCFYTGIALDPVAWCTTMWDDGVWTPAN